MEVFLQLAPATIVGILYAFRVHHLAGTPRAVPGWRRASFLGGLGLILPGLLHIRPGLTPLAAVGLMLVTIGATVYQLAAGQVWSALFAAVVAAICAFIAYGRWRLAPLDESSHPSGLQQAS